MWIWDGTRQEAIPHARLASKKVITDTIKIIPTIFITNRTLLNLDEGRTGGIK